MTPLSEDTQEVLRIFCHELAGPLGGVQAHAENLVRYFKRKELYSPERVERIAGNLTQMSRHTIRLLKNFSWLAYPDPRLRLECEHRLTQLLESCARDAEYLGQMRDVVVRIDRESVAYLNGKLRLDRHLFEQALWNVLFNAVEYSYKGTSVHVKAALLSTGEATITITNRGIPILKGEEDKIFNLWYRSKAARIARSVGAGIGLTVARDIVRLHGGELSLRHSIELSEGQGYETTFVITLPLRSN